MDNQVNNIHDNMGDQTNTTNNEMNILLIIIQIGLVLEYLSTKCIINLLTSSKGLLEFRGKHLLH